MLEVEEDERRGERVKILKKSVFSLEEGTRGGNLPANLQWEIFYFSHMTLQPLTSLKVTVCTVQRRHIPPAWTHFTDVEYIFPLGFNLCDE